ncbi:hypothetical protein BH20CHL2_BH20CHL2_00820 [soil metagenome]
MPKSNPATGQIVWRKLDHNPVTWKYPNIVLAHTTAQVTEDGVSIFQLDRKHGVGQCFDYLAFDGDRIRIRATRSICRRSVPAPAACLLFLL